MEWVTKSEEILLVSICSKERAVYVNPRKIIGIDFFKRDEKWIMYICCEDNINFELEFDTFEKAQKEIKRVFSNINKG